MAAMFEANRQGGFAKENNCPRTRHSADVPENGHDRKILFADGRPPLSFGRLMMARLTQLPMFMLMSYAERLEPGAIYKNSRQMLNLFRASGG